MLNWGARDACKLQLYTTWCLTFRPIWSYVQVDSLQQENMKMQEQLSQTQTTVSQPPYPEHTLSTVTQSYTCMWL